MKDREIEKERKRESERERESETEGERGRDKRNGGKEMATKKERKVGRKRAEVLAVRADC